MKETAVMTGALPQQTRVPAGLSCTAWCHSRGKRLLDVLSASLLLILTSPLLLLVALLVVLTSPGPVFLRQLRLGQEGKEFTLLKFRTMTHTRRESGLGLTRTGDSRVTRLGRFLRLSKVDELPQFFNVLRGQMSLVGPRPDLARYFAGLDHTQRCVLELKPGITGMASLHFRHEERLLAAVPAEKLETYYISTVLPQKIQLDVDYARRASFLSDLKILLATLLAVVR